MPLANFDPWWMFRFPLSGDVNQRIQTPWFSPSVTVNYKGNPEIEQRVTTDVASYGRQIGWLMEIALALARNQSPPEDTLRQLSEAHDRIEAIKKIMSSPPIDAAISALDRLKDEDLDAYQKLIRDRQGRLDGAA